MPDTIFDGTLESYFRYKYTAIDPFGNRVNYNGVFSIVGFLAHGSNPGQSSLLYVSSGIIPAGSSVTIDLTDSIEDMFGNDLVFTGLSMICIKNNSPELGTGPFPDLVWDTSESDSFNSVYTAQPGNLKIPTGAGLLLFNPKSHYPVQTDVSDKIKLINTGSSAASYQILIAGR